jgi:hypothetical protein
MRDFTKQFEGITFCGEVLSHGPYLERLAVTAETDAEVADVDAPSWPSDEWVSEATGESVRHWAGGELGWEEVYLPVGEDVDAAETARVAFGP